MVESVQDQLIKANATIEELTQKNLLLQEVMRDKQAELSKVAGYLQLQKERTESSNKMFQNCKAERLDDLQKLVTIQRQQEIKISELTELNRRTNVTLDMVRKQLEAMPKTWLEFLKWRIRGE